MIGQGGVARASLQSIEEWMTATLNPDMFISTTENIASHGARFPATMQQELENVPGVAEVQAVRMPRMQFQRLPGDGGRDSHGERGAARETPDDRRRRGDHEPSGRARRRA